MRKHLKNFLIPHEGNTYKPDALQKFSVTVMAVLVVFSFAIANVQSLLWIGSDWLVSAILPAVIVDLTNEEREDDALGTLKRSVVLDKAAQAKADDMAKYSYFAHFSPSGVSPWFWFDQADYTFVNAGENLAVYFTDTNTLMDAWMDSPGHRANILGDQYTEIGIGTAQGEYNDVPTVFVVQLFGTPAAKPPAVTNVTESIPIPPVEEITIETITEIVPNDETIINSEESEVAPAQFETVVLNDDVEIETPETNKKITPDTTVLYSDISTTSVGAVPATVDPTINESAKREVPTIVRTATQPSLWLQLVYGILSLAVLIALTLSIAIEWRRQHPMQIAYGTGLLATMAVLFFIHSTLTTGVTIL